MDAQPGASADLGSVPATETPTARYPLLAYRTWAWRFFAILDGVAVLGAVLALGVSGQDQLTAATILVIAGASIALLTVLLVGIDRDTAWAVHAIAPACTLVIVFGILRAVVSMAGGHINIPLEVAGAALVLSRSHPAAAMPALGRTDRRSVALLIGAMLATQIAPYLTGPGPLGTGGLLSAQPADLAMSIDVRCDEIAANGAIPVAVSWTWRRGELLAPEADGLLVQWYTTTNGSGPADSGAYLEHDPVVVGDHVWSGGQGAASAALQPHTMEGRSWELGIGRADARPGGAVQLDLRPADTTATAGEIEVWTWYAHGDRWTQQSASVGCQWAASGRSRG